MLLALSLLTKCVQPPRIFVGGKEKAMTTLIEQALDAADWAVTAPVQLKNVQASHIQFKGAHPVLQLLPRDDLRCRVPFAPGVFKGTGEETRLNVLFDVPPSVVDAIERIEQIVRDKVRQHIPLVDSMWSSCLKTPYGQMRCKINIEGVYKIQLYDQAGEPMSIPIADLAKRSVVPIINFRGVYIQRAQCGLMMDCSALVVGARPEETAPRVQIL
jgi:hypothetical protein